MAKTKKKNNVTITSVESNNEILKQGVKTTVVNKKPRQPKKKQNGLDELKKDVNVTKKNTPKKNTKKKTTNKNPKKTTKKEVIIKPIEFKDLEINNEEPVITKDTLGIETPEIVEPKVLTREEILAKKKERNRKKYEKGQKKYRESKEKKKIEPQEEISTFTPQEEVVEEKVVPVETDLVKKEIYDKEQKKQEKERKEKRKTNTKTSGFTQTLTNIKEKSVTKINDVREMTTDNTIPLGKTIEEKTKRSKRLIKESIVYAIILTIINVLCIVIFDYFNFLRLFDIKALNVVITVIISLIFNFFVAFMVDYFVTNVWLIKRNKKKDGEQDGNSGAFKEEHREDIQNKEGE